MPQPFNWMVDPDEQARRDALAAALGGGPVPKAAMRGGTNLIGNTGTPTPMDTRANDYINTGGRPTPAGVVPDAVLNPPAPAPAQPKDPRAAGVFRLIDAGYSDEEIKATLKKAEEKERALYDPTKGGRDLPMLTPGGMVRIPNTVVEGAGQRVNEMVNAAKQWLGADNQADIDRAKREDAPLKATPGGAVGSAVADVATFAIPGAKAGAAVGKLLPATRAFLPGVATSAVGGGIQAGLSEPVATGEDRLDKVEAGAAGGAAGHVVGRLLGRAITPVRNTTPERNALVKVLEDADVKVSAGQATNSPMMQAFESAGKSNPLLMPILTAGSPEQKAQYTRAVARMVGQDGPLTPATMAKAQADIGGVFRDFGNTAPKKVDNELFQAVEEVAQRAAAAQRQIGTARAPAEELLNDAMVRVRDPLPLTGDGYLKNWTYYNDKYKAYAKEGQNAEATVARELRDAYDDFFERKWNAPRAPGAYPAPGADLAQARTQWKIFKDLQTPGVLDAEGLVSPARLKAVVAGKDPASMSTGKGSPYTNLVRAGDVLKPGGADSGTARNYLLAKILANPWAMAAGGGLYGLNSPEEAIGGAAGLGSMALLAGTQPGRKYMGNSIMNNQALARALRQWGTIAGANVATE